MHGPYMHHAQRPSNATWICRRCRPPRVPAGRQPKQATAAQRHPSEASWRCDSIRAGSRQAHKKGRQRISQQLQFFLGRSRHRKGCNKSSHPLTRRLPTGAAGNFTPSAAVGRAAAAAKWRDANSPNSRRKALSASAESRMPVMKSTGMELPSRSTPFHKPSLVMMRLPAPSVTCKA